MATIVGQLYNLGRFRSDSLLELDNADHGRNSSELGLCKESTNNKWKNETINPGHKSLKNNSFLFDQLNSEMHEWPSSRISTSTKNCHHTNLDLSFAQLLGLRQLLDFINGIFQAQPNDSKYMDDYVTWKKPYDRNRFSRRSFDGSLFWNNQSASMTCLAESVSIYPDAQRIKYHHSAFKLCKRRHCNSESGLYIRDHNSVSVTGKEISSKSMNVARASTHSEVINSTRNESASCETEVNLSNSGSGAYNLVASPPVVCEILKQSQTLADSKNTFCISSCTNNPCEMPNHVLMPLDCSVVEETASDTDSSQIRTHALEETGTIHCVSPNESILSKSSSKSSLKLAKVVSFADEVGKSLTETFVLQDETEAPTLPEYDDYYDDFMLKCKPKFTSFKSRFTRTRARKYFTDNNRLEKNHVILNHPTGERSTYYSSTNYDVKPGQHDFQQTHNYMQDWRTQFIWHPTFPQPASKYYEFRQKLESNSVALESVTFTQPAEKYLPQSLRISGTIKVKNLAYEKQLWLRLTTDKWQTFADYPATYSPELSSRNWSNSAVRFDTFVFAVFIDINKDSIKSDTKIEFAIHYIARQGNQMWDLWDNNNGLNFVIESRPVRPFWVNTPNNDHVQASIVGKSSNGSLTELETDQIQLQSYTLDYQPNSNHYDCFTDYRAWRHFAGETSYY